MAADPRFFATAGPLSLAAIAAAAGAECAGDPDQLFDGVAPLQMAGPRDVSFLDNRRYAHLLAESRAGAVVLAPAMQGKVPASCIALPCRQPQLGYARIAALFHPTPRATGGIHPQALVAADAQLGPGCEVAAFAVVSAGAVLGEGCVIGSHALVGPGVVLGARCHIHHHASITHTVAGDGVVLHPGARVGNEGFGFVPDPATGHYLTVPQIGRVMLGDGVQVGANSTVDRGAGGDTVIGAGSRIDNLVQIGHNVRLGRGCVVVAMAGVSGSSILGDHVVVAAQAGVAGHLVIGDRARIGAQAGVINDVPAGQDVLGFPAQPARDMWRQVSAIRRLARANGEASRMRGREAAASGSDDRTGKQD